MEKLKDILAYIFVGLFFVLIITIAVFVLSIFIIHVPEVFIVFAALAILILGCWGWERMEKNKKRKSKND